MRLVVFGYVGYGNLGDEAVLAGTIRAVRARAPGAEIVAISADPRTTERVHGVRAVARRDLLGFRAALKGADGFLLGGGSLLQDRTSTRSVALYLSIFEWACRHVPSVWWAMGLGPLNSALSRRWVAAASWRAAAVVVRDAPSGRLLQKLGGASALFGSDAAFALQVGGQPRRLSALAVAPRPFLGQNVEHLGKILREAAASHAVDVVLLPFQPAVDGPLCVQLARLVGRRAEVVALPEDPVAAIDSLGRFPLLLATRLHGMLLAAVAGVPSVFIPYDPKVKAFGEVLGLPGPEAPGGLLGAISSGLSDQGALERQMMERIGSERERLATSMETVLDLF